ncbi:hypothetical protein BU25DRAFT_433984 [Macroventuria anomochaeta]|uniref:Uncharacterized protein n=1 Tax=Macroventuria anomochaeta TaxID=301207 RepID=A0ACB6RNQ7_9PLEO|nr:uncharacterized protein BU25DRAFT_433984 [Macroventuria anomochaeta]KAF2623661.1 hypothetical protein BU25DRAFT_433984 [Macroventuria anomochaeta]
MFTPARTPVSNSELLHTNAAMLSRTSLFIVAHVDVHVSRSDRQQTRFKNFEPQGFFVYFAFVLYLALWICYRIVIDPMFRPHVVYSDERPPYPTIIHDASQILRLITAAQMCFYTSLLSLLNVYHRIWWGIIAAVILPWVGSVLSSIFTCSDLNAKFNQGRCGGTSNEVQMVIFCLYFADSVDVLTDLIATMPEPKWVLLWNVLETSMAVIIGSSPAFVVLIRKHLETCNTSYNARGYRNQASGSGEANMNSLHGSPARPRQGSRNPFWDDGHCSHEELAKSDGGALVTTTVHQESVRISRGWSIRQNT